MIHFNSLLQLGYEIYHAKLGNKMYPIKLEYEIQLIKQNLSMIFSIHHYL